MLDYPTRYPRLVVAGWLLLLSITSLGLLRAEISIDTRAFFSADHPGRVALREFESRYSESNTAFLALTLPIDATVSDAQVQDDLSELTAAAWNLPGVLRVDSLSNHQHATSNQDDLQIRALFGDRGAPALNQVALDELFRDNASLVGQLVSKDRKHLGLSLNFVLSEEAAQASSQLKEITSGLESLIDNFRQRRPAYEIHLIGMVPLIKTFGDATLKDLSTLIPMALNVSGVILLLLLRSIRLAAPVLACASAAGLMVTGIWSGIGQPFNVATSIAPVVVLSLVLAGGLHIVIACRHQPNAGDDWQAAVSAGIKATFAPSRLAWLTTTTGFLAFNAASAPPFRELGNFVALGITLGYLMIYSLLPAVSVLLGPPQRTQSTWSARMGEWITAHQSLLLILCLVGAMVSGAGIARLVLDDQFATYFDDSFEYRQAVDYVEQRFTGTDVIEINVPHPTAGTVSDPAYIGALTDLVESARRIPGVTNVVGLSDIVHAVHRAIAPDEGSPTSSEHIGESLFLYELGLPAGKELGHWMSVDRSASRVSLVAANQTSVALRGIRQQVLATANEQGYFNNLEFTGLSLLYAGLSLENVRSMMLATALSVTLIAAIVAFSLGSARYGLLCLAVSLLPLAVGFGVWGWTLGTLGLPGAVIVALTIGIIVDDAIHFIHRYHTNYQRFVDHNRAVISAVATAGEAIVLTSISLLAGFALLVYSGFQVNQHVGLFTCIVLMLALVFDLLALPRLLSLGSSV